MGCYLSIMHPFYALCARHAVVLNCDQGVRSNRRTLPQDQTYGSGFATYIFSILTQSYGNSEAQTFLFKFLK